MLYNCSEMRLGDSFRKLKVKGKIYSKLRWCCQLAAVRNMLRLFFSLCQHLFRCFYTLSPHTQQIVTHREEEITFQRLVPNEKDQLLLQQRKKKKKKTNPQHSMEGILFSMNLTNQITFHKVGWQFDLPPPLPQWPILTWWHHFFTFLYVSLNTSDHVTCPCSSVKEPSEKLSLAWQHKLLVRPGRRWQAISGADLHAVSTHASPGRQGDTTGSPKPEGQKGAVPASRQQEWRKRRSAALSWTSPPTLPMKSGCDGLVWTLECSSGLFQLSFPINAGLNVCFESLKPERHQTPFPLFFYTAESIFQNISGFS